MACGGFAALATNSTALSHPFCAPVLAALLATLCVGTFVLPATVALVVVVALSTVLVASDGVADRVTNAVLGNRFSVGLGLISYGIYMWHQPVLAFARYCAFPQLQAVHLGGISVVILLLAIVTYYAVESPFRNPRRIGTGSMVAVMVTLFLVSMGLAVNLYIKGGVVRDVPELGISVSDPHEVRHSAYNSRIHGYDRSFAQSEKIRVLVAGNSFARDWANVLLESDQADRIEISYVQDPAAHSDFLARATVADVVFFSGFTKADVLALGIQNPRIYVVGPKNFGASSGIFYNYRGPSYFGQRTRMLPGTADHEARLSQEWGDRYVSLIAKIVDADETVPVFTPDRMFISVDCRHFTQPGAKFFASMLRDRIRELLDITRSTL